VAKLSNYSKQHIGCIVVYKKQILAVGYNQNKTHTLQAYYNKYRNIENENIHHSVHAEIQALSRIRHMDIDWSKVEVYTYREHKQTGQLMMSKPCPACLRYLMDMGIQNVYYTDYGSYCCNKIII
jgi:deoxycytidylate deaminase